MGGIDWGRLAGLAAAHLGWPPGVFWDATPYEFRRAWTARFGTVPRPMARSELSDLLDRFPDGDGI